MRILRIVTLLALGCLLASCGSNHHHDSSAEQYTQAIFPAGIKDANATQYDADGVTPKENQALEITYNNNGNIAEQQWQCTAEDEIFSAETTLYNSLGDPEQITGLLDEDEDQTADYAYTILNSYDADNNLASQYSTYTPTDAETPDSINTRSYSYDISGNMVFMTHIMTGNDGTSLDTEENIYNDAEQLVRTVLSVDKGNDQTIDSRYMDTFEYDDQGRLTTSIQHNDENLWPDTTINYTCNTDNRIEQTILTGLGMWDYSKKVEVIRQYEYLDNGYPATTSYEYIETDLDDVMTRNIRTLSSFYYDESQRITTMEVEEMDLMTDTLVSRTEWLFTYSADDTQATLQVMDYSNANEEGVLKTSGTLNMVHSGLFSQLYHKENQAGTYTLLPLPLAVANGEFFTNTY